MTTRHLFTALTPENSARVTLSDPRANSYHSREAVTLADARSVANLICRYSRERMIPLELIQVSIRWPDGYTAHPRNVQACAAVQS